MRWKCPQCDQMAIVPDGAEKVNCRCTLVDTFPRRHMVPDPPGWATRAIQYVESTKEWIAAGCPLRTDHEILAIVDVYCSRCPWHKEQRCTHAKCGCGVLTPDGERATLLGRMIGGAFVNKLRRATEACPDGRFKAKV